MKKFFRFTILGILAIGLMTALLVSCGVEKPNTIKFMVDGTWLAPDDGEEIPEEGWEALTGIDLEINHPPHNEYYQKVELAYTTGEMPDVFVLGTLQYVKYAKAGALYDMTEMYEKSKMKANMSTPDFAESLKIDGKLYGIPYQRGNGTLTFIRMDWLEKLGMKEPTNYSEFIDMLRAFKNNNPDGIPPNKVIPITGPGLVNNEYPMDIYLREFYQDATPDYLEVNGKWVDGMLEANMKGALTRMRDAYAEGLIDKEIITNKTSDCRNKFFTGVVGAFNYWAGYWNDRLQQGVEANVSHAKVRGIGAIKETFYVERPTGGMVMSSKVKNPQAIFDNWMELLNDNGPGQTVFTFGVEGKSYYIDSDGTYKFMPTKLKPDVVWNKVFVDPSLVVTTFAPKFEVQPLTNPSHEIFRKYNKQYPLPNASEILGKQQAAINKIKAAYISKIVYGEYTIEDGLKKYTEEIGPYNKVVLEDMNK